MGRVAEAKRRAFIERKIAKVEAKLGKGELKARAEGALVVHQANVAETVLKSAGIKLAKGRRLAERSGFDADAFLKGKEDARNIDLDRRALKEK